MPASSPPSAATPHVLREYALLADGERGALIGPDGAITWLCTPRWDSRAVFSALVGGGGFYAVSPSDPWFVWGGHYQDGSLIWRSRWTTTRSLIECREALALPADPHVTVVLRRIDAIEGEAQVDVRLDPRADFGEHPMTRLHYEAGIWTARAGSLYLRWAGASSARRRDGGLEARVQVSAGQSHDLVLEISDQPLDRAPVGPDAAWAATEAAWQRLVPDMTHTLTPRDCRHAYATLAGLTSQSGGMVAAATAALPERSEGRRNYDYRFSWIRDQSYAGQAVAADGPHPLLTNAIDFISARLLDDGPELKPAYTVDGGTVPGERNVAALTGYPGGGTMVGNSIDTQFQLDSFGETLLLFAAAERHDLLDVDHWRAVETAVDAIGRRWHEPDAGVWELDTRRWAHSRLTCAAGLRSMATAGAPAPQAAEWSSLADTIVSDTTRDCLHPSGRWQRSPGDPNVDAALLLPAVRGALAPDDPRSDATYEAVRSELSEDGFIYRFRHDERPLEQAEGAFLLCGYFAALTAQQRNERTEARMWFERTRSACGPPRLYSEEYDIGQRQLRGNLPQAFVHALMLEASSRLARPWSQVEQEKHQ